MKGATVITREEIHALMDKKAAVSVEWDKKVHEQVRRLHEEEGIAHSVMEIAIAQTVKKEPELYDKLRAVKLEANHVQQDVELDRLESEKKIAAGWAYMMERDKRFDERLYSYKNEIQQSAPDDEGDTPNG